MSPARDDATRATCESIMQSFKQMGRRVDGGVPVLASPLCPSYIGPIGRLSLLLRRGRLIVYVDAKLELWRSFSGFSPTTMIGTFDFDQLRFSSDDRTYMRVHLGTQKLWMHEKYLWAVSEWRADEFHKRTGK